MTDRHTPNSITAFRKRYFPGAGAREWNDWRWQMRHRVRDAKGLERLFSLTEDEQAALQGLNGAMPLGITPYYAALISRDDTRDPLRKAMIPRLGERHALPGEQADPLGEQAHSPVPGLVHTYPDKVLFLVTDLCASYCRYCTRSRIVGKGTLPTARQQWEQAIEYIRNRPEIRDVLISGGDPLILSDARLEWLLTRLRDIPHVEMLRIGTKIPAVLPQRITPDLARMLKRFHPLYVSIHFTHPSELTKASARACSRLADAGIPLGSQTVLLAGINDDLATMRDLMHGLLNMRVKPYYLHQCDPVSGTSHFRTPIEKGVSIIRGLHGHTTGYAVPAYMLDAAGGGGKVPINPDYIKRREGNVWILSNYRGLEYRYAESVDRPTNA